MKYIFSVIGLMDDANNVLICPVMLGIPSILSIFTPNLLIALENFLGLHDEQN